MSRYGILINDEKRTYLLLGCPVRQRCGTPLCVRHVESPAVAAFVQHKKLGGPQHYLPRQFVLLATFSYYDSIAQ